METDPKYNIFGKILYLLWLVCILLEKHVFHLNGNRPKIQYFLKIIVFAVVGLHFARKTNCECNYTHFSS